METRKTTLVSLVHKMYLYYSPWAIGYFAWKKLYSETTDKSTKKRCCNSIYIMYVDFVYTHLYSSFSYHLILEKASHSSKCELLFMSKSWLWQKFYQSIAYLSYILLHCFIHSYHICLVVPHQSECQYFTYMIACVQHRNIWGSTLQWSMF